MTEYQPGEHIGIGEDPVVEAVKKKDWTEFFAAVEARAIREQQPHAQ